MKAGRAALALLGAGLVGAAQAGTVTAQTVERVGSGDVALDRRIARILASPGTRVLAVDTMVPAGDTVGTVLVLDATLILEGTVAGDLVTVDGGLFVRAGSRVDGDLVNAGGALTRSPRASIGGRIMDFPDAEYRVERGQRMLRIVARSTPVQVTLDGPLGVHVPRYDRVDGVTVGWGAGYDAPLVGPVEPSLHGWVAVRTARGALAWGGDLLLRWGSTRLSGGVERATRTPDRWLRGDVENSLAFLWDGADYRNYYEADRLFARLQYEVGDELKRFHGVLGVEAQIEEAQSLDARDPWTILEEPARPNPAVDEGRLVSGAATVALDWTGLTTVLRVTGRVEAARTVLDGEYAFDRYETWGTWAIAGLLNHTLEVRWRVQGPLPGTDSLPRQRWSGIGGNTTLQTYPVQGLRGDRLAYVQTDYSIPLPRWLALPVLGAPDFVVTHAAGRAWTGEATDLKLEQNVGAALHFFGVYLSYMHDPSGATADRFVLGLSWPFTPGYPWQR